MYQIWMKSEKKYRENKGRREEARTHREDWRSYFSEVNGSNKKVSRMWFLKSKDKNLWGNGGSFLYSSVEDMHGISGELSGKYNVHGA